MHHDLRLAWENTVTTGLAARGISITSLPDGVMASAFIEGATPEQFIDWATQTGSATANNAAPAAAPGAPSRPSFAPVSPGVIAPTAPIQSHPAPVAGKPVKPAAKLVTLGVAVHFAGGFIAGFGEGLVILLGGQAFMMLGGLIGATGVVLTLIGVHRFLVAQDRHHCQAA